MIQVALIVVHLLSQMTLNENLQTYLFILNTASESVITIPLQSPFQSQSIVIADDDQLVLKEEKQFKEEQKIVKAEQKVYKEEQKIVKEEQKISTSASYRSTTVVKSTTQQQKQEVVVASTKGEGKNKQPTITGITIKKAKDQR